METHHPDLWPWQCIRLDSRSLITQKFTVLASLPGLRPLIKLMFGQSFSIPRRNSSVAVWRPPSPWIDSIKIAAVWSSTAFSKSATCWTHKTETESRGSNPCLCCSIVWQVPPWFVHEILTSNENFVFGVLLVSVKAWKFDQSLICLSPQQNKIFPSPIFCTSLSAKLTCSGMEKRFGHG